ncbi:MAG: RDD family protein [Myxococcales bacterium]|nr:RDD family protein [Myxococcales bacterium]
MDPECFNPFEPPATASVSRAALTSSGPRLASRGWRFVAVLIDGVIVLPFHFAGAVLLVATGISPLAIAVALPLLGLALYVLFNLQLLHEQGQTIGKRLVGVRIVASNGARVGAGRLLLRQILTHIAYLLHGLVWIVDVALIFGERRRCLHDLAFDTIVVEA